MTRQAVEDALALVAAVPGYEQTARRLRRTPIYLKPDLPDRAQTTLRGHILLGQEPFAGGNYDAARVSLAATLVHESHHLRQHSVQKTASFWLGFATHTHPMRRYEAPAYAAQEAFLAALACECPDLAAAALEELAQVQDAFMRHYGPRR